MDVLDHHLAREGATGTGQGECNCNAEKNVKLKISNQKLQKKTGKNMKKTECKNSARQGVQSYERLR